MSAFETMQKILKCQEFKDIVASAVKDRYSTMKESLKESLADIWLKTTPENLDQMKAEMDSIFRKHMAVSAMHDKTVAMWAIGMGASLLILSYVASKKWNKELPFGLTGAIELSQVLGCISTFVGTMALLCHLLFSE